MARVYPGEEDLRWFIETIQKGDYSITPFLPPVSDDWYRVIDDCVSYAGHTAKYEELSFIEECARLLYKVAKRHELGDGNKRSAVIMLYLFCLLNDCYLSDPRIVKNEARRAARSKGRKNEELIRRRMASALEPILVE